MVKHKFKVKYGYGSTDFVSIEAGPELDKAIYAMINNTTVALGNKMVQGKNIITIEPHYHAYTGWYDHYQPKDGDDWAQIERDCPEFDGVFEAYAQRVRELIAANQTNQIGKLPPITLDQVKELRTGSSYAQQLLDERRKLD